MSNYRVLFDYGREGLTYLKDEERPDEPKDFDNAQDAVMAALSHYSKDNPWHVVQTVEWKVELA